MGMSLVGNEDARLAPSFTHGALLFRRQMPSDGPTFVGAPSYVANLRGTLQSGTLSIHVIQSRPMLSTLQDLFDKFTAASPGQTPQAREHAVHLAAAVLLVEVMRAEPGIDPIEREAV